MRILKNSLIAAFLTAATIMPGFAQKSEPRLEKRLTYKGMVWAQKTMDFSQNDLSLISINTVKHPKWKGFGVMGILAVKPFNSGKNGSPIIPLAAVLAQYGGAKANINAGPVFKAGGRSGIDGYRILANIKEGRVGLRAIFDTDHHLKLANLDVHGVYAISNRFDATLGVNSMSRGAGNIQAGMALKF